MVQRFLLKGNSVRFIPESHKIEYHTDFGFRALDTTNPNSVGNRILVDFEKGTVKSDLVIVNESSIADSAVHNLLLSVMRILGMEPQQVNAASIYKDKFFINDQCIGCSFCDDVVSELTRRLI